MADARVIVVGAGIAGLVSAYQLQKQGIDVTVLEAASSAGGRMLSESIDGYIIDAGAQFLSSAYPIVTSLIEELDLRPGFVETSRYVGIVREGRIFKFRYDRPHTLLFGGFLKLHEWLAFAAGNLKLLKRIKDIPLNDYSAWESFDNESVAEWAAEYYGDGISKYFIEPMLEAFYFQAPEETSKALAVAVGAFGAHKARTMTLKGGIQALPKALAARLNIIFNTPVQEIRVENRLVRVHTASKTFSAERVVLATPATVARSIYKPSNETEESLLNTRYSTTVNVSVALSDQFAASGRFDAYGIWIPREERDVIAAITVETNKCTDRAHSGELINVMLSGRAGSMLIDRDEDHVLSVAFRELEKYLPGITGAVVFTRVYRWADAEPMSPVGRCRNIRRYRETLKDSAGVILAGDYLGMPFTEGAAETGNWAASRILNWA